METPIMKMSFTTPYNYDRAISALSSTTNTEDSMTQQNDAKDCDINVIMQRYKVTGQIPLPTMPPRFGDFSEVTDYRTAIHQVMSAKDTFNKLPAKIRARFSNNPALFLDFFKDPANLDEAVKLGLVTKKEAAKMQTPAPPPATEPKPKETENGKT